MTSNLNIAIKKDIKVHERSYIGVSGLKIIGTLRHVLFCFVFFYWCPYLLKTSKHIQLFKLILQLTETDMEWNIQIIIVEKLKIQCKIMFFIKISFYLSPNFATHHDKPRQEEHENERNGNIWFSQ